jgi:hypothetical protein
MDVTWCNAETLYIDIRTKSSLYYTPTFILQLASGYDLTYTNVYDLTHTHNGLQIVVSVPPIMDMLAAIGDKLE